MLNPRPERPGESKVCKSVGWGELHETPLNSFVSHSEMIKPGREERPLCMPGSFSKEGNQEYETDVRSGADDFCLLGIHDEG